MLDSLAVWLQSDLRNSVSTYPLKGGGFAAVRVTAQTEGPAKRVGFTASGTTVLSALLGINDDVARELDAPTQPHHEIPTRDEKAPETRPTGVESWAPPVPRHSMVDALRDCDSATQRAARIAGKGVSNG